MLVVDASVAVKWLLPEPGRPLARRLLTEGEPLCAPDLLLAEVGNALWKNIRRGMPAGPLREAWALLPPSFQRLVPMGELAAAAFDLALRHDHPVYDCFYVALARRESAPLITADARLADRFAAAAEIRLLGGT
jgi:predicted nucleic acid-binding protein